MQNVVFQVERDRLVIIVDLSKELGVSSSGKSIIIATTEGNVALPGHEEVKIGLNIYRPHQSERNGRRTAGR